MARVSLPLAQARVVGGRGGLHRAVRAVNVMEVPDILEWVQADELLLTTAYPLRDDRLALDALVPRLAGRGLAGIAIKPARYIDAIPASRSSTRPPSPPFVRSRRGWSPRPIIVSRRSAWRS